MRFEMANPATETEPAIQFIAKVDGAGDFVVKANGRLLLFITQRDGKLTLAPNAKLIGLAYDRNDCIKLYGET